MTILAGFSASRHSDAPINLAMQIADSAGEPAVAAAVVEHARSSKDDSVDKEYLEYLTEKARQSLNGVVRRLPGEPVPAVVHESSSIPKGLIELAAELKASIVVVGSSSSGLLGRLALGSVTDRLVHTAALPVAIAPRGYPAQPDGLTRISASYGAAADVNGLIPVTAELAKKWSLPLRIVSFTVRPSSPFGGRPNTDAEALVVDKWARRTRDEISRQLDRARTAVAAPEVDVAVGSGTDWRGALESVGWQPGDILALGSGAAGPLAQVFLGSAASKILRHSPVPVMIMPRPAVA
jgi:nucleotide-binding universal stress UspA family protein